MVTPRCWRQIGLLIAVVVMGAGIVKGQSTAPKPVISPPDELLVEVRALRADFQQVAKVSVRAQLLVGRLQLQEQRINILGSQLRDIRQLIVVKQSGQLPLTEQLKRLEDESRSGNTTPDVQKDLESMVSQLKARLALMQKEDRDLRAQDTELSNQLATEQARWMDFNSRLDELERQLPVGQR